MPASTCPEALHPTFLCPRPGSSPAGSRLRSGCSQGLSSVAGKKGLGAESMLSWGAVLLTETGTQGAGGGQSCNPLRSVQSAWPAALPGRQNNPLAAVFQESPVERAHGLIDPRDTWMLFVRQSDKGVNSKRGSRGKAKKLKVSTGAQPVCACVRVCVCVRVRACVRVNCHPQAFLQPPGPPPSPHILTHRPPGPTLSISNKHTPSASGQRAQKCQVRGPCDPEFGVPVLAVYLHP